MCRLCEIYNTVEPVGDSQYWKFFIVDSDMYAIWYKHEGLMNMSKCKRMATELQGRLFQFASSYFKTNKIKTSGELDTHVYYKARII